MKLYQRENYLKKIRGFYHDTGMIKVLTGVRRSGKSCILLSIRDELRKEGIPEENLIFLNLDERVHRKIQTADQLEALILRSAAKAGSGIKYLFIDEVQNVKNFEEVINGFREEETYSIFITGSNSYLLSGELVTKLTGRYVEFEVYTLTFAEYLGMKRLYGKPVNPNVYQEFQNYIQEGGFPKAVQYDSLEDKRLYVQNVVQEIFEKDIRRRTKVRHVSVFNRVRDYMLSNFGATTSIGNIWKYFRTQEKIPIKRETIQRYVQILTDAKILYSCKRFDLKSKRSLAGEEKYYLADLGFYFAMNTDNKINYGPVLENIIYLYAASQGYQISVGRIGKWECDFILRSPALQYAYVQVSRTIADPKTEEREYKPLESVPDSYPKYVMTTDFLLQQRNGIHHVNLIDFLAKEEKF